MKNLFSAIIFALAVGLACPVLADSTIYNLNNGSVVQPTDRVAVSRPIGGGNFQNYYVNFGNAAQYSIGTTGATVPLLSNSNAYLGTLNGVSIQTGGSNALCLTQAGTYISCGAGTVQTFNTRSGNVTLNAGDVGSVLVYAAPSHQFFTAIGSTGAITAAQPGFTDLSGSIAASQLIPAGTATLGGVFSFTAPAHQFLTAVGTTGQPIAAQPAFTDISGTATGAQLPAPTTSAFGGLIAQASSTAHQVVQYINTSGQQILTQLNYTDLAGSVPPSAIPAPTSGTLGGVTTYSAPLHQFVNGVNTAGALTSAQPAFSDVSGSVAATQLPTPGTSALGGVLSYTAASHNFLTGVNTSGSPVAAQPAFTDISGTASNAQIPAPTTSALGGIIGQSSATASSVVQYVNTSGQQILGQVALGTQTSGILPSAQGGVGVLDSGMTTGATDNSSTIQAVITSQVTKATTNGTYVGVQPIQVLAGKYNFACSTTPCFNSRPAIKINTLGPTWFNFASMTGGGAISVYNDDAPTGSFTNGFNAENFGPFLNGDNGGLRISGPGATTSTYGLAIGDNTAATADANFRDTSIRNVVIKDFGTCIKATMNNLYMLNYSGMTLGNCKYGLQITGTNNNSGERMSFYDTTFGASENNTTSSIDIVSSGTNLFIEHSSADFQQNIITWESASGGQVEWSNGWWEDFCNAIVLSNLPSSSAPYAIVQAHGNWIVPSCLTSLYNRPNRAIFQGYFTLDLDGTVMGGWPNPSHDPAGLFMADSRVIIKRFTGHMQLGYHQLVSQSTLLNNDPLFATGTNGNDLGTNPMSTWRQTATGGISAAVDNSHSFSAFGGTQSILFTGTANAGTNYNVILTNAKTVSPGDAVIANAVVQGQVVTNTGAKISMRFLFSSSNADYPTVYSGATNETFYADYNDSTDPYVVAQGVGVVTYPIKMNNLPIAQVPAGYDRVQLEITMSGYNVGDKVNLEFAGENSL